MAKSEIDKLLEQNTIDALKYIDEMHYYPDTDGYKDVMLQVRKNYELLIRNEAIAKNKRRDRWVTIGLGAAEILIPAALYLVIGKSCLVYEETGAITSAVGRSLVNKIRPDKY